MTADLGCDGQLCGRTGSEPGSDDSLAVASGVTRSPRAVSIGCVYEVAAALGERVENREALVSVGGPAEHIATEAEREDVEVAGSDAGHDSILAPPRNMRTFLTVSSR